MKRDRCPADSAAHVPKLDATPAREENAFSHRGFFLGETKAIGQGDGSIDATHPPGRQILSPTADSLREKEKAPPQFRPLGAALAGAPAEPDWHWDGYLAPRAITLLAGKPKAGKSTFLFGLFGALTTGAHFLGRPTSRCGLLLLSEEREDTLAEKQRRFGLGDGIELLMRHESSDHSWGEIIAAAVAHCRDRGPYVLAIDTWDKWAGLSGDMENSSGAVNAALGPLMVAAASGLAVVIVTHQRKSSGSHGEAVRGSNALVGGVDVIVELERVGRDLDPSARVLRAESRYAATPDELVARLGERGYAGCADLEALREEAIERRILEALRDGELTTKELADAIDQSHGTVSRYAGQMHEAGKLHRGGRGRKGDPHRWSLTPMPDPQPNGDDDQPLFPSTDPAASIDADHAEGELARVAAKFDGEVG